MREALCPWFGVLSSRVRFAASQQAACLLVSKSPSLKVFRPQPARRARLHSRRLSQAGPPREEGEPQSSERQKSVVSGQWSVDRPRPPVPARHAWPACNASRSDAGRRSDVGGSSSQSPPVSKSSRSPLGPRSWSAAGCLLPEMDASCRLPSFIQPRMTRKVRHEQAFHHLVAKPPTFASDSHSRASGRKHDCTSQ
jgi:hypothetical protein